MTLRELLLSVSDNKYTKLDIYQKLLNTKPEYGANRHIEVKKLDDRIVVTNVHIGSLGDILTYHLDIDPNLNISKELLLESILTEMSPQIYTDFEQSKFWDEMTDLQKAKIIR